MTPHPTSPYLAVRLGLVSPHASWVAKKNKSATLERILSAVRNESYEKAGHLIMGQLHKDAHVAHRWEFWRWLWEGLAEFAIAAEVRTHAAYCSTASRADLEDWIRAARTSEALQRLAEADDSGARRDRVSLNVGAWREWMDLCGLGGGR